ncbi:phosphoglucosamine mutase [Candidatus Hydrogenedentota bacterium]
MGRLFGTDGVRGVANKHPMTCEMALKMGRAAGQIFMRDNQRRHRILIGKDTRLSGYMIESALLSGICSMGVDVILLGPLPTPGVAYITRSLRADAGVMISASHNPYEDNGIKFFSPDGFKLPDEVEEEIEGLIYSGEIEDIRPTAHEIGKAYRIDGACERYIEFTKATFPKGLTLDGMKIVVDCANGAAYQAGPAVLTELGAEVIPMHTSPNGRNINRDCGSTHPDHMAERVKKEGAHIGAAFDGDADRVILADENGLVRDGDAVMGICGLDMMKKGTLKNNTVVTTVLSNVGLETTLTNAGGHVIRTKVGDRYVVEAMRDGGYSLGGEESGHLVFLDLNTTGDGLITLLQVIAIMRESGQAFSKLADEIHIFPQAASALRTEEKPDIDTLPGLKSVIESVEKKLGPSGKVLVRYSGTEPKLRIMVQGPEQKQIDGMLASLLKAAARDLNVDG